MGSGFQYLQETIGMKHVFLLLLVLNITGAFAQKTSTDYTASVSLGTSIRLSDNLNRSDQHIKNHGYTFSLYAAKNIGRRKFQAFGIAILDREKLSIDSAAILDIVSAGHYDTLAELGAGNFSYTNLSPTYSLSFMVERWKVTNILAFGPSLVVKDAIVIEFPNSNVAMSKGGYFFGYQFRNILRNEIIVNRQLPGFMSLFVDYGITYGNVRMNLQSGYGHEDDGVIKKTRIDYKLCEQHLMIGVAVNF